MTKITPFLWFDDNAEDAVGFYVSVFPNAKIHNVMRLSDNVPGPKGKAMVISFELAGQPFSALNGGPVPGYSFTSAVSFAVNAGTRDEAAMLWEKLSAGGSVLMPFQKYPFSEGYGWCTDRFGVSWQINAVVRPQMIAPALMFTGTQFGKAEEAMRFYASTFSSQAEPFIARYEKGEGDVEGKIKYSVWNFAGQDFMAMESSREHKFGITGAISFVINCDDQEEVDHYWNVLTEGGDPKFQQCGWLADKYGVAWQVVPTMLPKLLGGSDREKAERATQAMMNMKKLDIAALQKAYDGT